MRLAVFFVLVSNAAEPPRLGRSGLALTARDGSLVVAQVAADSNATRAGIASGDVIVSVGGQPAAVTAEFAQSLIRQPAGSEKSLDILRAGKTIPIRLRFAAPPSEHHPGITIEYGAVNAGGHLRRTLLTRPANGNYNRLIVWIAGSGCASQESLDGNNPKPSYSTP
ncbi:MAG: PDZ domain-containing protein [Acidobacteria bacterium]|nr:PDZ domain-containing protein [Acidobacteriota bacterium]